MKNCLLLIGLCAFSAVGASAQLLGSNFLNGEPQMLVLADHPQHATQVGLAQPQDLLEHTGYTYAQGEVPLWEVMPPPTPAPPLGDVARAFKEEHALSKRATRVWNN